MVVKRGVDRGEFLQRFHLPKSEHRPFSSPERQVTVFHPIVLPTPHLTAIEIAQFAHRCRVRSKPVGDDCFGPAVTLQCLLQEGQSRCSVPFLCHIGLEDFALRHLVDRQTFKERRSAALAEWQSLAG